MENNPTSQERLSKFIDLYEKYYDIPLSENRGEELLNALLGLLGAVQEGCRKGRYNNTALVNKKNIHAE